jgi:hypothetical protein
MRWNGRFLDVAFQSQCRIINYPKALQDTKQTIGSNSFDPKAFQVVTYKKFMPRLLKANGLANDVDSDDSESEGEGDEEVMKIVSWDEGTQQPLVTRW